MWPGKKELLAALAASLREGEPPLDVPRADLPGVSFPALFRQLGRSPSRSMAGANLEGANLEGADLSGCILEDARLDGANLRRARIVRSTLNGASLRRADLRDADLSDSSAYQASFAGALLDGIRLDGAEGVHALRKRAGKKAPLLETLLGDRIREVARRYAARLNVAGLSRKEDALDEAASEAWHHDGLPSLEAEFGSDKKAMKMMRESRFLELYFQELKAGLKDRRRKR